MPDHAIVTVVSRANRNPGTPYVAATYPADTTLGSTEPGVVGSDPGGVLIWALGTHVPGGRT